jgi:dTMP kinase
VESGIEILKGFVVLEGLDGSGTSTQIELLRDRARREGRHILFSAEPTEGRIGSYIREILRGDERVLPETLAMLYAADRNEHVNDPQEGIRVQLQRGWVVSDRYLFSSLAYQGSQCDWAFVQSLNGRFPLPERVVFVELSPEESARRRLARGANRELFDAIEIQKRVYDTYNAVFRDYEARGVRVHRVDGTPAAERIADQIWEQAFR